MGVDIIVVNYRTPNDLRGFVRSLEKNRPKVPHTLTIVNVAPTQEDHATAWDLMSSNIGNWDYVFSSENVGYGTAVNNAGARRSLPVIAAFNADTRIQNGVVESCYKALMRNPEWGILGPRQVDSHGKIVHGGIYGSNSSREDRSWKKQATETNFTEVKSAVTVSGSAFFIKRDIWNRLTECPLYQEAAPGAKGPFLPTPHYYEETYCSYHARDHGWDVVYYGAATMTHKWHQASRMGGYAEKSLKRSRTMFREACDLHGIEHD